METPTHSITSLFKQLGLGSTDKEIEDFINRNKPLSG
ncbi:MAG: DUF2789 family protein, partial [Gammaproteobacteria bacterium]|nr:DUF2789 family protein [Gammaproteobacteria bacterium]